MKTQSIILALATLALSGCSNIGKIQQQLADLEKLGVTHVTVTGKFSHTDYTVTKQDGVRRAELNHTNVWVPQVKVIRETPAQ